MTPTWFIITIAVIMAIGVTVAIRREDPFQSAARSLGLELTKRLPDLLPRLDGIINSLPVRIEVKDKYAGGVDYTVFYPPLNLALRLERETTITRTLGQLGENDTQVGARVFDDSFRVNTSRPDALRSMMTPELRKALIDLIERYPRMVVSDGSMTLSSDSVEPTADEVTATIAQMAAAAAAKSAPPSILPSILSRRSAPQSSTSSTPSRRS